MRQLHGHGTLVVAQYTSEGIAVASDRLQISKTIDGTVHDKKKVLKLFLMDGRTVCALTDLSTYTGFDEKEYDFGEVVTRAALSVRKYEGDLSFQQKCNMVANELSKLLRELSSAMAEYQERVVSTLLFFGYQGKGARFGVQVFEHEGETIKLRHNSRAVKNSTLWVFGPFEAIKARLATMGIGFQMVGKALAFPVPDSSLMEAASFVDSLISESIEAEPEILGGPVQVATIPRNPEMEPPPLTPETLSTD